MKIDEKEFEKFFEGLEEFKEELKRLLQKLIENGEIKLTESEKVELQRGNIDALIRWVADVGFSGCVASASVREVAYTPERLCGWLKHQAKLRGYLSENKLSELQKKINEMLGVDEKVFLKYNKEGE